MAKERKMSKAEKEYIEYLNSFPDWYWVYSLHDAEVLKINQLELPVDYKTKMPKYNCLEILLDSKGARESDIKKITLYNYKVLSGEFPEFEKDHIFWLRDTLTQISNDKYKLDLILESGRGKHSCFEINFQFAEVIRK